MIPLILLAGGSSRRMGRDKAQLDFFGRRWLEAQIAAFGGEVIVVSSADVPGAILQPRPHDPPWSSLLLGLRAIDGAAFVLPIDVPLGPGVCEALSSAIGSHEAAVPAFRGARGHPVLLSASLRKRLAAIEESRLDRELAGALVVDVGEPMVRMNLNTPGDWSAWLASPDARRYPRRP